MCGVFAVTCLLAFFFVCLKIQQDTSVTPFCGNVLDKSEFWFAKEEMNGIKSS